MAKIFSITGWSGSGKTTLITRLVKHFKSVNKRVITVKHTPGKYYLEPEATDTFKFLEAGSDMVFLAAKNELLAVKRINGTNDVFAVLESQQNNCDFLLMEGLRKDDVPMIEVYDSTKSSTPKFPFHQLTAIVSDKPVTDKIPNFHFADIDEITKFMEDYHD
jgi:molybdopterin-guanine dinucleotide biosynthesis protein MobB